MKRILLLLTPFLLITLSFKVFKPAKEVSAKPRVCLTYDDGSTFDMPGYSWKSWDNLLLESLKKNKVQAVFFAAGMYLDNDKGKRILSDWSAQGHLIANHTYSHKSYNKPETTYAFFANDFLKNDSIINSYANYTKLFRFPYLKEGETVEKRDSFRAFLKEQGYKNGYVTIDASDWYVNSRLLKRLKQNPEADIESYKQFYLEHIYDRAVYYNTLSIELTGRQISHSLLLHHNLASALFTDDLIAMFKAKGWEVINAGEAYQDEIYTKTPDPMPAGESLIWALAKEKGTYESRLRYPAEDGKYEEAKMDKLGL